MPHFIGHKESIAYLRDHKNEYMELVITCLKEHVKNTLTLLATHGWQRSDMLQFADTALHSLSAKFAVPLGNAKVNLSLLGEEWKDMVEHAKQYLDIVKEDSLTI